MVMITKQIILDAKRFDTNPKREFLGPNKTRTIIDLEEYTREWSLEEISSMDKTDHLCMAWMYIGDLKKSSEVFDQTGIRPDNNTDQGILPLEENGWLIGKKWDWAIMVVVNPSGELIGYRNGRRRTFNLMDIKEDWIPVNIRVDYEDSSSPIMDKILSGSIKNAGTGKNERDIETLITNGVAIINANEGIYVRTRESIEKLVKVPYPDGLDVYADFTDRGSVPGRVISGIWNRTADSDNLTRIMDGNAWGEWYTDTQMAKIHSLKDVRILCTDGQAPSDVLNVHILKEGPNRLPWILYSKKDTPRKAVESVSAFKTTLETGLKDAVKLMIEMGMKIDHEELPESGLRPWNILGVMPMLNSGKFKKYYANGMLIPETEFLQFNTTNLYELCDRAKNSIDNALLGEAT